MSDIPKTLFKYFSPERTGFLDSLLIRYTPMTEFNDPFEGRPNINGLDHPERAIQEVRSRMPAQMAEEYSKLPRGMRRKYTLEQFIAFCEKAITDEGILSSVKPFEPMVRKLPELLLEQVGVLCLSEVCDSLLMWAHYGCSHRGFVVEFDTRHPHFNEKRSDDDEHMHLRRVIYRETRKTGPLREMDGVEILLVKSSHWSYEREWRIIRALTLRDVLTDGGMYLFKIPPEAITSVTLGCRSSPATESQVRMALARPNLRHVVLRKCEADDTHFVLNIGAAPACV